MGTFLKWMLWIAAALATGWTIERGWRLLHAHQGRDPRIHAPAAPAHRG